MAADDDVGARGALRFPVALQVCRVIRLKVRAERKAADEVLGSIL